MEELPKVFVSYSHKDKAWLDLLRPSLLNLTRNEFIQTWDDTRLFAGDNWYDEIFNAIKNSSIAICLITQNFLASTFCTEEEVPYILDLQRKGGLRLIPIKLEECDWEAARWLKKRQMRPSADKSVKQDYEGRTEAFFAELSKEIREIAESGDIVSFAPPHGPAPTKVDLERLPDTGSRLFGRNRELILLERSWANPNTRVVVFDAEGGVGKSTLVGYWCREMEEENYKGARLVFGWSFYSQGSGNKISSSDDFVREALRFFGDPDPADGNMWEKTDRLVELLRKQKTLLVLDGLEPLQYPSGIDKGKLSDPPVSILLTELAEQFDGLCVVTTREPVVDLADEENPGSLLKGVVGRNLEFLKPESGRALLRVGKVIGSDGEIRGLSEEFGNHALALKLLAKYLNRYRENRAKAGFEIPLVKIGDDRTCHARRVIRVFEKELGEGAELEALRMLGLFDRPADPEPLAAVRNGEGLPGMTEKLRALDEAQWQQILKTLRSYALISKVNRASPGQVDAHPIIREHFHEELQTRFPRTWRKANIRLYEYYRNSTKYHPDTIEEMLPLFQAMSHGCNAKLHSKVLNEIFIDRINRNELSYCSRMLYAHDIVLSALDNFFKTRWSSPADKITTAEYGYIINSTGFTLTAIGKLREAEQPLRIARSIAINHSAWPQAISSSINLIWLLIALGQLRDAKTLAYENINMMKGKTRDFNYFYKMENIFNITAYVEYISGNLHLAKDLTDKSREADKKLGPNSRPVGLNAKTNSEILRAIGNHSDSIQQAQGAIKFAYRNKLPLEIGFSHLELAQSFASKFNHTSKFKGTIESNFNTAILRIRESKDLLNLSKALICRSAHYVKTKSPVQAKTDLHEAFKISSRSGMRLNLADYHLISCRLALDEHQLDGAREHLAKAKTLVNDMGYGLRYPDIEELEARIGPAPSR